MLLDNCANYLIRLTAIVCQIFHAFHLYTSNIYQTSNRGVLFEQPVVYLSDRPTVRTEVITDMS